MEDTVDTVDDDDPGGRGHRPLRARSPAAARAADVQRLGRWPAVGITVAVVAIFVVLILSAMR